MLISSKWNDYYDVVMRNGMDKTVVYNRETISIKGKFPHRSNNPSRDCWDKGVLAFCGKFYPFVFYINEYCKRSNFIWNEKEALRALNPTSKRGWDQDSLETETGIKKFFSRKYPELEDLFHKHKVPIFGFNPSSLNRYSKEKELLSLVLNPNLKELEFYKVKDPFTAYQDIYMFISGVIGTENKKPRPIDDKIMASSKGHDGFYSFKKCPKGKWR